MVDSAIRKGSRVSVLVFGEQIAGYANYGRNRARSLHFDGEIYELYLKPEFQGLGFGRRLFSSARRDLAQSGLKSMVIWALSDNEPAVEFYRNLGGRMVARSSSDSAPRTSTRSRSPGRIDDPLTPHGEERAIAVRKNGVASLACGGASRTIWRKPSTRTSSSPSFETAASRPPQDEAESSCKLAGVLHMRLDAISIGKNPPHEVNVIVEVPVGGEPIKYEMDKASGTLVVDRFLYTSMRYPGQLRLHSAHAVATTAIPATC